MFLSCPFLLRRTIILALVLAVRGASVVVEMYVHMNQAMAMLTFRKSTESFIVKLFCIQISHNQTCTKNRENRDSETAIYFKPRGIALYTNREKITQTPRLRTFSLSREKDPRNRCSDQIFKSRNYHSLTLD